MNKKGFTLIELIAVIVIMGILLLIVFPSVSSIMRSNENKKYDTYYNAVKEQIELYARTRRDELGGIEGTGCVDDKTLSNLKTYDYIKEFDDKKITCKSPSEFTNAELENYGIDSTKQYVNIRIENNKGIIDVEYSMICIKEGKSKPEYKNLILKNKNCENYVPVAYNSLINVLKDSITGNKINTVNNTNYVKGNVTNNYVWYSGKMWRVVYYNTNDNTIKLVTDDNMSLLTYNNLNNNYVNSNIYNWLNNEFLPTLRSSDQYLQNVEWNYSNVDANVTSPITGGNVVPSKVGLLNNYEYLQGKTYLSKNKNFWLISTTGTNNAWYVNKDGNITSNVVSEFYGVRPAVVLKSGVTYVAGGNGTVSNPYKLTGDNGANPNTLLNTRFSGEYVILNSELYRISSVNAGYTKLILDNVLDEEKQFHDNIYIDQFLKGWIEPINNYLIEGDFCRKKILKTEFQTSDCDSSNIISTNVAIPKIGDMFTVQSDYEYWTLTNALEDRNPVVQTDGTIVENVVERIYVVLPVGESSGKTEKSKTIEEKSRIRPVIVVDNSIIITGGNGTKTSPYTLGKDE